MLHVLILYTLISITYVKYISTNLQSWMLDSACFYEIILFPHFWGHWKVHPSDKNVVDSTWYIMNVFWISHNSALLGQCYMSCLDYW